MSAHQDNGKTHAQNKYSAVCLNGVRMHIRAPHALELGLFPAPLTSQCCDIKTYQTISDFGSTNSEASSGDIHVSPLL